MSADSGSVSEPGRSHHPLAARADGGEDAALRGRRAAIGELGDALRELVGLASATEVPADVLRQAAAQARQAAILLGRQTRTRTELPGADDSPAGPRLSTAAGGDGSSCANRPRRAELRCYSARYGGCAPVGRRRCRPS
jgi:hypothetical protein